VGGEGGFGGGGVCGWWGGGGGVGGGGGCLCVVCVGLFGVVLGCGGVVGGILGGPRFYNSSAPQCK